MAQYRAIFNNAYFKGLASAAIVTAAMAAGQAQAADGLETALSSGTMAAPVESYTVSTAETLDAIADKQGYINNLTIANSGALTFTQSGSDVTKNLQVKDNLTVQSGGTLTLTNLSSSTAVIGIIGVHAETTGVSPTHDFSQNLSTFNVDGGTVDITKSHIQFNNVELNNAKVTIKTNNGQSGDDAWTANSMITAVAQNDTEGGFFTVTGDKTDITLDSGSQLVARTFNLKDGVINMKGDSSANDTLALIRSEKDGTLNIEGADLNVSGAGNYLFGKTINIKSADSVITVSGTSTLTLSGQVSNKDQTAVTGAVDGTVNFTAGKIDLKAVDSKIVLAGKDGNKGVKFYVQDNAQLTGLGAVDLGEKSKLIIDQKILDGFVKAGADTSAGNGGKVNFTAEGAQVLLKNSADVVDLSSYAYGSGANADFDVTNQDIVGKIIGDKLAISKAVTGTFTNAKGTAIKVEADELTLGKADAESKASELQGTVFTQLTAKDKLVLAGKDNKFTFDKGDYYVSNSSTSKVSTIEGADLSLETARISVKGDWTSNSNITFAGAGEVRTGNFFFAKSTKQDSSLTLTGTITNAKTANNWGGITTGDTNHTKKSTLDITGATLKSTATPGMVTFGANNNGTVKISGQQATDILKATEDTKGFHLGVSSGGTLDIQGAFSANFDDFAKFTGTGATDSNKITFGKWNDGQTAVEAVGGIVKAQKATLTTSDAQTPAGAGVLNLQAATPADVKLQLEELVITNNVANEKDVTIKSGSVVLSKALSSENENLIVGDGALLDLNTSTQGTVSGLKTLTVSGATAAALKVNGKWTMANTGLVVGKSGDATIENGANLTVAGLTTSDTGSVSVIDQSKLVATGALKTEDGKVSVKNDSTFVADYTEANKTTALGKVAVDATSHLELTGYTSGSITLTDLAAQKTKFLNGDTGLFKITGKNGATLKIEGGKANQDGTVAFTDAQSAANLEGVYSNNTVTGVNGSITTTNDWGTVELDKQATQLELGANGAVHLNGAPGKTNLVADSTGKNAADVQMGDGSMLIVNASGSIKDIKAAADNNGTILVNDKVNLTVGNIGVNNTAIKNVEIDASSKLSAKDIFAKTIDASGKLAAQNITAETIKALDQLTAKDVSVKTFDIQGSAEVTNLTLSDANTANTIKGKLDVKEALNASGDLTILNAIKAGSLVGASGKTITVGQDGAEGASGLLDVGTMDLKSGSLILDPDFNDHASLGFVGGTKTQDEIEVSVGGNVGVGQNAAFVAGMRDGDAQAQAILDRYTNAIGSLDKNSNGKIDAAQGEFGAMFIANGKYTVADGEAVIVDPAKKSAALKTDLTTNINNYKDKFTLGNNAALLVTDSFAQSILNKADKSVIAFGVAAGGGSLALGDNSKIIIDTALTAEDTLNLVSGSGTGATVTGQKADTVIAANGLLQGTIGADGKIDFTLEEAKARAKLYNQSQPVQDLTIKALEGKTFDKTDIGIDYILNAAKDLGGKAAEGTARLAVYGGAVQGTALAQQAANDAVVERMSRSNPNGSLVFANNAQGGGMWLSPVYKTHESDSFDADGVDYGVDSDLTGLVLGADTTTASGVRVGGYFNFGSADFDGQGVGDQVSNEADYFGLGLYAGMTFGQFSLLADAGFTQVSNDIEQSTGVKDYSKVTADTDSSAVTLGLRGEYKLNVATMDVTPHLGMRFTRLDVDSYDAKVNGKVLATSDFDTMQMFSIPFGVTVSKDIAAGAWTIKPVFDLTLTANAGDTDAKLNTTFIGANSLDLTSEAFDSFTYGATFGLDAKYGENFSIGLNTNYTGSSNADEFGVMGNARYMF